MRAATWAIDSYFQQLQHEHRRSQAALVDAHAGALENLKEQYRRQVQDEVDKAVNKELETLSARVRCCHYKP